MQIYNMKKLRLALKHISDNHNIACQIVDQEGNAWNMLGEIFVATPPSEDDVGTENPGLVVIKMSHPQLTKLPKLDNEKNDTDKPASIIVDRNNRGILTT